MLVIGYGNPTRSDDGFGPAVAQAVAALKLPDWQVIACQQLTPELAEDISQAEQVVFVDASREAPAGKLRFKAVEPLALPRNFTHHLQPGHLLMLAAHLYGHAPQASMVTVGAASLEHGEKLTAGVQARVTQAARAIRSRFFQDAPEDLTSSVSRLGEQH